MKPEPLFEVIIHTLNGVKTVAALHVSAPALVGLTNVHKGKALANEAPTYFYHSAFLVPALKLLELAAHFLDRLVAHFAEDLPGLRQLEADLQKLEAQLDRYDFRFLRVELDTEPLTDLSNSR